MQTNDLNRLAAGHKNIDELRDLLVSPMPEKRFKENPTIIGNEEEIRKLKTQINEEFLKKVRADVAKYQLLGKSRRWIKRWVIRKYNLTEY